MHKNRLVQLVKALSVLSANGVLVTVITNSPENLAESKQQSATKNIEYLQSYGIRIFCKTDFYHKFAIIDRQFVWYGSVNFLSFSMHEDCVMRLNSAEVGR